MTQSSRGRARRLALALVIRGRDRVDHRHVTAWASRGVALYACGMAGSSYLHLARREEEVEADANPKGLPRIVRVKRNLCPPIGITQFSSDLGSATLFLHDGFDLDSKEDPGRAVHRRAYPSKHASSAIVHTRFSTCTHVVLPNGFAEGMFRQSSPDHFAVGELTASSQVCFEHEADFYFNLITSFSLAIFAIEIVLSSLVKEDSCGGRLLRQDSESVGFCETCLAGCSWR